MTVNASDKYSDKEIHHLKTIEDLKLFLTPRSDA
jgi:hypothetical protein